MKAPEITELQNPQPSCSMVTDAEISGPFEGSQVSHFCPKK